MEKKPYCIASYCRLPQICLVPSDTSFRLVTFHIYSIRLGLSNGRTWLMQQDTIEGKLLDVHAWTSTIWKFEFLRQVCGLQYIMWFTNPDERVRFGKLSSFICILFVFICILIFVASALFVAIKQLHWIDNISFNCSLQTWNTSVGISHEGQFRNQLTQNKYFSEQGMKKACPALSPMSP